MYAATRHENLENSQTCVQRNSANPRLLSIVGYGPSPFCEPKFTLTCELKINWNEIYNEYFLEHD